MILRACLLLESTAVTMCTGQAAYQSASAPNTLLSFCNCQEVRESCKILYIIRHQIWRHLSRFREFLSPAHCTANCFFTQQVLTSYVGLGGIAATGQVIQSLFKFVSPRASKYRFTHDWLIMLMEVVIIIPSGLMNPNISILRLYKDKPTLPIPYVYLFLCLVYVQNQES